VVQELPSGTLRAVLACFLASVVEVKKEPLFSLAYLSMLSADKKRTWYYPKSKPKQTANQLLDSS